jgi:serine/threonine protein phosphatase PrpC
VAGALSFILESRKAGGNSMYRQNTSPEVIELHISAAGCTDAGRERTHNEDTIALCEPAEDQTVLAQSGRLYLLADGAGSHAAGKVASWIAVETISSAYYDQSASHKFSEEHFQLQGVVRLLDGSCPDLYTPMMQIRRAFFAAHTRIRELATLKQQYADMATTCIAAVVKGNRLLIAHAGDCRAYLIHTSSGSLPTLTRLTTDHSIATELEHNDVILSEPMHSSFTRYILLRALGGSNPYPDITTCLVQAGDYLVLCCDGLWSKLTEQQMAVEVSNNPPQEACNALIRLANEAGGEDNISTIVISFS